MFGCKKRIEQLEADAKYYRDAYDRIFADMKDQKRVVERLAAENQALKVEVDRLGRMAKVRADVIGQIEDIVNGWAVSRDGE